MVFPSSSTTYKKYSKKAASCSKEQQNMVATWGLYLTLGLMALDITRTELGT
jgi:hypothetical protein